MQTCAQGQRPGRFSLTDLQDVSVGDSKQMQTGCTADIGGDGAGSGLAYLKTEWFGWPENGEFEWGGLGDSCSLCAFQYGCECGGGIGGKRGKVKRKQYLGDPKSCCLVNSIKNQTKIIGDKTCAPENRDPTRDTCREVFRSYCGEGSRIVTDESCKNLDSSNNALFVDLMKTYCNKPENVANSTCIQWCKNNVDKCPNLNTYNDCIKYGICESTSECAIDPKCTAAAVNDIQGECSKLGIVMSSLGTQLYACTRKGIDDLVNDCKENNIDKNICTPQKLQDTIDNQIQQQQLNLTEKAMTQSSENYQSTKNAIMNMLGDEPESSSSISTTSTTTSTRTNASQIIPGLDDNTFYIILIVLIVLSCCSSISSSLGIIVVV